MFARNVNGKRSITVGGKATLLALNQLSSPVVSPQVLFQRGFVECHKSGTEGALHWAVKLFPKFFDDLVRFAWCSSIAFRFGIWGFAWSSSTRECRGGAYEKKTVFAWFLCWLTPALTSFKWLSINDSVIKHAIQLWHTISSNLESWCIYLSRSQWQGLEN